MNTSILKTEIQKLSKVLTVLPEVRYAGDPILRKECKDITKTEFKNGTVKKIVRKMKTAMLKYRKVTGVGRGLAANQLGISKKIILLDPLFDENFTAIINPKILKRSKDKIMYPELCWSWGALVTGNIERSDEIVVEYLNEKGEKQKETFTDIMAILLQHEIGHVYGELCTDFTDVKFLRFTDGEKYKPKKVK